MDELDVYWSLDRYRVTPADLLELDEAVLRRRRARMPEWGPAFAGVAELAPCPLRDRLDEYAAGTAPALLVRGLGGTGARDGGIVDAAADLLHVVAARLGAPAEADPGHVLRLCPPGGRPARLRLDAAAVPLEPGELLAVRPAAIAVTREDGSGDVLEAGLTPR